MHPCRSRSVRSTDRHLLAPLITLWLSVSPHFHKIPITNFVKIRQTIWHFTGRENQGIGPPVGRYLLIFKERLAESVLPFWTKTVLKHACGPHWRHKIWVIRFCRLSCTVRDCLLPPQSMREPHSAGLIAYGRFWTTCRSHLQGEMRPIGCPETSVRN